MKIKKYGQITVRRYGKKYAVSIMGTPKELYNSIDKAEEIADKLRYKCGRKMLHCKKKGKGRSKK